MNYSALCLMGGGVSAKKQNLFLLIVEIIMGPYCVPRGNYSSGHERQPPCLQWLTTVPPASLVGYDTLLVVPPGLRRC